MAHVCRLYNLTFVTAALLLWFCSFICNFADGKRIIDIMPLTISYLFDLEAQRKDSLIINLGNCSEMFFQDKEYSFLVHDILRKD